MWEDSNFYKKEKIGSSPYMRIKKKILTLKFIFSRIFLPLVFISICVDGYKEANFLKSTQNGIHLVYSHDSPISNALGRQNGMKS